MPFRPPALVVVLLASNLLAQAAPERHVTGGTLVSKADPAASFKIDPVFQYVGGQVIDILKVAGAEQHFFIEGAADHSIRRFYWLQFEHFSPDNTYTYNYSGIVQTPVSLGRLAFMGDVRSTPDYFTDDNRPGSDSKAAENFLRAKGFKLDGTFVTLRLFHLPDVTKRRELMIIYGEILPRGASGDQMKAEITARAQAGIAVQ
jgi:hypothetical protein